MEERLIHIIKTGKGEIKDLVAAENELGVWRTKIEEMEGEIRYYANQVSLSTLTITLAEKEIQAPTAIVVTETVAMRIEVEDVAKAHQIAMKAVEELKGRITRSELKQHTAGQFLSILHAEIPPAKKDAFREQLKKLGIVSDHQGESTPAHRRRHRQGARPQAEAKRRRFDVTMHNTANIRPRAERRSEDRHHRCARRLMPSCSTRSPRSRGRCATANSTSRTSSTSTRHLDFNVPTSEKPGIDKLLDDIGPVLERVNIQAPVNELSTASKFGYTLLLRDFASIPPQQGDRFEIVATTDVPGSYAKLLEAIAKAKGQVVDARLNEQDKFNINAQIDFTVPTDEKAAIDKLLDDIGTLLSRNNVQAPMNQLSTARKFGYSVTLRDFANILPGHAADIKLATTDVPNNYAKLVDAIVKAKGQISDAKLNEQDKLNMSAFLNFTVPIAEKAGHRQAAGRHRHDAVAQQRAGAAKRIDDGPQVRLRDCPVRLREYSAARDVQFADRGGRRGRQFPRVARRGCRRQGAGVGRAAHRGQQGEDGSPARFRRAGGGTAGHRKAVR